jgi:hypothetical protein
MPAFPLSVLILVENTGSHTQVALGVRMLASRGEFLVAAAIQAQG